MTSGIDTPVLFLIFNRPEKTGTVFQAIRKARPRHLYIAADGPREHVAADRKKCEATREAVAQVDWPCEVRTLYREKNLGCRYAVSSAITWFFDQVEDGIILEDDCLPHPDFFTFCSALLNKYSTDDRVMHISGANFQFGIHRGDPDDSYYFSRISHIWGWASWRRAWKHYDVDMKDFPSFFKNLPTQSPFTSRESQRYWLFHFKRMYHKADTWDYQWTYAVMKNNGYCIMPNVNLISNIGFGGDATHATQKVDRLANMATSPLGNLVHPSRLEFSELADDYTIADVFPIPGFFKRAIAKILKTLNSLFQ